MINILKLFKYLFYDIIPEMYSVKWFKHDFDSNFEYYCNKPIIYIVTLVVSFFDIRIVFYRIVCIIGFIWGMFKKEKGE